MAKRRSMTRNQKNHGDITSSSRKSSKTCALWSDINHDVLTSVMKRLGVLDFLSFRGVCRSWRSLACENENMFMASSPPMSLSISSDTNQNLCYLEGFEGRKFKTILPRFSVVDECIGLTCGYLIFYAKETHDFWLVNPMTRNQLHFPHFPIDYHLYSKLKRAILVSSPSTSGLVFVVLCRGIIWFSIEGKGAWNNVPNSFTISDFYAFKGKIYTLSYNLRDSPRLCELRLYPKPKFTILKIKKPDFNIPKAFGSSRDNLYVVGWSLAGLHELDVGEMKWVKPCGKTIGEYAFFRSELNDFVVSVKRESWVDSRSHRRIYTHNINKMWYFPHDCINVDRIDE